MQEGALQRASPPTNLSSYYQISLGHILSPAFERRPVSLWENYTMNRNTSASCCYKVQICAEYCKFNTDSCERVKRHISKHTSYVIKSGGGMISIKRNDKYIVTLLLNYPQKVTMSSKNKIMYCAPLWISTESFWIFVVLSGETKFIILSFILEEFVTHVYDQTYDG